MTAQQRQPVRVRWSVHFRPKRLFVVTETCHSAEEKAAEEGCGGRGLCIKPYRVFTGASPVSNLLTSAVRGYAHKPTRPRPRAKSTQNSLTGSV